MALATLKEKNGGRVKI